MSHQDSYEPMLDMFIFETSQLMEQLEQTILISEKGSCFSEDAVNEIFRIMHTIKGSSAMMMFQNISNLAHSIEDLFFYLREDKPENVDCSDLSDLVLESIDCIKLEIEKIKMDIYKGDHPVELIEKLHSFLSLLKKENDYHDIVIDEAKLNEKQQYYIRPEKVRSPLYKYIYKAIIFFDKDCEMENIHAYTVLHRLKEITDEVYHLPENIIDSEESIENIRQDGFIVYLKSNFTYEETHTFFMQTVMLQELELVQLETDEDLQVFYNKNNTNVMEQLKIEISPIKKSNLNQIYEKDNVNKDIENKEIPTGSTAQNIISVSVAKLDKLMDLVGEMVIAEAMVIQNPDLQGLELNNFYKAARQLNKITTEIQDTVMSVRMVPLSATFHKMHRIVRDMSKKLNKELQLKIIGEETEVDKNIMEHISDPLMHLVRNAMDHGIETVQERLSKQKQPMGTIVLEAKNVGSDVLIIISDDGRGLDKDKIRYKAIENGVLDQNTDEMSDKDIYNLILLPGFSTKDNVTEFSGRGVGMDVVIRNIETIGGSLSVNSEIDKGTTITLKIPLTLAIIDGMNIKVGNSNYTIPTISIKESFRPTEKDIITDPDKNEMIMVRGQCYPMIRLHEIFHVPTEITEFIHGIIIMVEQDNKIYGIFADELIGQQQVVVKALPNYIKSSKLMKGLTGCTLLGDGSISLILNIAGLFSL